MASLPVVITGAHLNLFVNNQIYKEVESVSFSIEYSEEPIFQIDSPYPAEIAGGKITVSGTVNGLRLKLSGGIEAKNMRSLFNDASASPYISLRFNDRSTQEDILFVPMAKVTNQSHSVAAKGTYKLNFSWIGLVPFTALDRS